MLFLVVLFSFQGISGIVRNADGNRCLKYQNLGEISCHNSFIVYYSLANKGNSTVDEIQSGVSFLAVILLEYMLILFHRFHHNKRESLDSKDTTASDFTILFNYVPTDYSDEEIIKYLQKTYSMEEFKISRIIRTYDVHRYNYLLKELGELQYKESFYLSLKNTSKMIENIKYKIELVEEELDELSIKENLKLTKSVFITFSTQTG